MRIDKEIVRGRLGSFVDLFVREFPEYQLRRAGDHFVASCPFHEERSASFHVYEDHGYCFGCGWGDGGGDHFAFIGEARGLNFKDALELCASRTVADSAKPKNVRPVMKRANTLEEKGRVLFPPGTRKLTGEEIGQLATLRGLSRKAIEFVAADRRVGFAEWPQFKSRAGWNRADECRGSWVVTDREKWVAQYRRLDGESYKLGDKGSAAAGTDKPSASRVASVTAASQKSIKAWTNGTPTWPIGASEIGNRAAVMLVEGGADMLAAYHFLWEIGKRLYRPGRPDRWLLDKVAVVCVLGASNRLCAESLGFFKGKRVRIFMDADRAKAKPLRPAARELEARSKEMESSGSEAWNEWAESLSEKEREDLDSVMFLEKQRAAVEAEPFDPVTGLPNQPLGWKVPSFEAACRWGEQLRDAGAIVETFSLYGIYGANAAADVASDALPGGEPPADLQPKTAELACPAEGGSEGLRPDEDRFSRVGDLNDLALCAEDVWMDPEIREGFLKWDF